MNCSFYSYLGAKSFHHNLQVTGSSLQEKIIIIMTKFGIWNFIYVNFVVKVLNLLLKFQIQFITQKLSFLSLFLWISSCCKVPNPDSLTRVTFAHSVVRLI